MCNIRNFYKKANDHNTNINVTEKVTPQYLYAEIPANIIKKINATVD